LNIIKANSNYHEWEFIDDKSSADLIINSALPPKYLGTLALFTNKPALKCGDLNLHYYIITHKQHVAIYTPEGKMKIEDIMWLKAVYYMCPQHNFNSIFTGP